MKKFLAGLSLVLMMVFVLVACNNDENSDLAESGTPSSTEVGSSDTVDTDVIQVVASFSIIADMVEQVGGDLVEVYTIVPIGEEPEEHEVLPDDIMAVTNADLIFYNGWNLEEGDAWLENLFAATEREGIQVTEGVTPIYLTTRGYEDYYDPHAWLDISKGIIYIRNITDALSAFAPEHADAFAANADAYIARLEALHDEWIGRFDNIPDSERLVVTAEAAFIYFGNAYGVYVDGIWELNAEDEGTPEQMVRIIGIINASNVRSLFIESSVEAHYIEQVSEETGVPIFGMLFTDSLSEPDGSAATYYDFMRHNLETIYAGLTAE